MAEKKPPKKAPKAAAKKPAEPAKDAKKPAEPGKDGKKPGEQSSPARERQEKQREDAAAEFQRQVDEGSLVIRKMTPAERKANPPRERPPRKGRPGGR